MEKCRIDFSSVKPKSDDRPTFEFSNRYMQQYTKENLKWYEGDGMQIYYDQLNVQGPRKMPEQHNGYKL